ISKKALDKFLPLVKWDKVRQKAETANRGDRLFPSKTSKNDKKYNFRFDIGS
ncbi:hypothetical protein BDZ85DRAFT_179034, partial [Elsinoe ampelina]